MVKKTNLKEKKYSPYRKYVALIILLAILFVFVFQSIETEEPTNNLPFEFFFDEDSNFWYTYLQFPNTQENVSVPFYYNPYQLEGIIIERDIEEVILNQTINSIIITVPPDVSSKVVIAGMEISRFTGERYLGIPTGSGLNKPYQNSPVITCSDADENNVIISFEKGIFNSVTSKNNCITIQFKEDEDAIKVADAFSYKLLKII